MLNILAPAIADSKTSISTVLCALAAIFGALSNAGAQASLSLSPAVIMAKGTYGQSLTQKLTINNQTPNIFHFEMMAEDIAVRDGKRVFLPAGDMENGIAATAIFLPRRSLRRPTQALRWT